MSNGHSQLDLARTIPLSVSFARPFSLSWPIDSSTTVSLCYLSLSATEGQEAAVKVISTHEEDVQLHTLKAESLRCADHVNQPVTTREYRSDAIGGRRTSLVLFFSW